MTTAIRTTTCNTCGCKIDYEPITWQGRELVGPALCDHCGEEWDRQTAEMQGRQQHSERVTRSQLPRALRGIQLPDDDLGELARQWAHGELRGLALTGSVGTGKTYLAAAAAWERMRRGGVRWISAARLMAQLGAGFGDEARAQASEIVAGYGPLVLDDLDKTRPSEYGREVLFAAVDNRVAAGAALLVTTNLAMSQVGDRLGDALASRLAGYCRVVEMQGEDRRLEAA